MPQKFQLKMFFILLYVWQQYPVILQLREILESGLAGSSIKLDWQVALNILPVSSLSTILNPCI